MCICTYIRSLIRRFLYFVSGIDYIVYAMLPEAMDAHKASYCWGISYSLSIIVRHFCHRYIVFGEYEGTYCASLCRTYATYSSSIVISIVSNMIITGVLHFSHVYAWFFTMLWMGIYNYFMLKATWRGGGANAVWNKSSDRLIGGGGSGTSPEYARKASKSDVEESIGLLGSKDYEMTHHSTSSNNLSGEQKGWKD